MYKLIVADDENIIRRGIVETLHRSADFFEVYEASNGEEVLQIVEKEKIDALIIDIKMPKMNGIAVLRQLWKLKKDILSVVLTGYEEFEYAKNALEYGAVKYVLKPLIPSQLLALAREMKETLDNRAENARELEMLREEYEKNRQLQKGKFLQDLLRGDCSEEWSQGQADMLHICLDGPYYQVAIMGIQSYGGAGGRESRYFVDYAVNRYLEKFFAEKPKVEFFQISSGRYIFLFNLDNYDNKPRIDGLYKLKGEIEKEYKITCAVGIGRIIEDFFGGIRRSFDDAELTLRYLNVWQCDYVSCIDEVFENNTGGGIQQTFDVDDYIIALKTGKAERTAECIHSFFRKTREGLWENNAEGFYLTAGQIILSTYQTLSMLGVSLKDMGANELTAIQKVYQNNTLEEMEAYLETMARKACYLAGQVKAEGKNSTIKKIKSIVDEEYAQPLSMKYIADKMYLNHIYLGQVFKRETGISLNDYINKVRIGKAKKLLKESNAMIYEVADQVGFSDSQYFSTLFKKIVGVSPKEYRDI